MRKLKQLSLSLPHVQHTFTKPTLNPDTCISLIKQCTSLHSLKALHASMLRAHLHLNLHFFANLLSRCSSLDASLSYSLSLFSSFPSPDLFLYNTMLQALVNADHHLHAILLYRRMRRLSVKPDHFTFPSVLKACAALRELEFGFQVHGHVLQSGFHSNVVVSNSLVSLYGKCERFVFCTQVFDEMCKRNVVSWSVMIGACLRSGKCVEGVGLFWRMLKEGVGVSRGVVVNVMACVCRESEADDVWRVVVDSGLNLDQSVQSAAVRMYSRCGRMDVARRLFDGIVNKDLVTWATMIEAYAQADLPLEALAMFRSLMLQSVSLDSATILSVVRACSLLSSFHHARAIHGIINRQFFSGEVEVETALVDLYLKCGSLVFARRVFDRMQERNVISWSTMISGYGMHGQGREALNLFNQMKDLVEPDHITFVSILSACSHAGLVAEGWKFFNYMVRDFGITPRLEHYACVVDLLGRAGKLNEALDFIQRMPVRPNAGVWGALLGACKIHANVDLAEVAANALFGLDAGNSGRYVILANIYASSGIRQQADRIRTLMKNRRVRCINRPDYSELERMMNRIRQEGYKPDTNIILQDVE